MQETDIKGSLRLDKSIEIYRIEKINNEWFVNIKEKDSLSFMTFHIDSFYRLITECCLILKINN